MEPTTLPAIPAKRYFTIGEVSELCAVKPYVLRYWEQEFSQLRPMKRRGNRRYYQHHEVMLVRRIRELLYEQGFTISGARNRLAQAQQAARAGAARSAQQDDVDLDTSALGSMTGSGVAPYPQAAISTQIAASISPADASGHAGGASKALRAMAPQASSNGSSITGGLVSSNGAHANLGSAVVSDLALQREALLAELQAIRALLDD